MNKLLSMISCNALSIALELGFQLSLGAAMTIAMYSLFAVVGLEVKSGLVVAVSGITIVTSLGVFLCRLHHRLAIAPSRIDRREDFNARFKGIRHDSAMLLSTWFVIAFPWLLYWMP